jgi:hypothetical protein
LFSVRNIAAQRQRLAVSTLEPLRQCLKLFLIARGNYNNGAGAGKLYSNRFSNTSASAGYQHNLISASRHSQKITHRLGERAIE